MEQSKTRIGAGQFFITMFVSRVVVTIALNAELLGGQNMVESIFSYLLSMALGLVIALPLWALEKRWPGKNVCESAKAVWGPVGKAVPILYLLYFIVTSGASLGFFQIFLQEAAAPEFSAALTMAALLAVALYGAFRGLETVARCAVCVFAFLLAGAGLVCGIVAFRFDPENLEPLFARGTEQLTRSTLLFLARTSMFADMAVLLPMVRGKRLKGFMGWAGGTAVFVSLLLLLVQGCLGPYAATQAFPVHILSSLTEVRSLQRLDAVFIGVWMMALIIKLACDIYACRVCFTSVSGRREPALSVVLTGLAVLALGWGVIVNETLRGLLLNVPFHLCCTLITGLGLPLLVLLGSHGRARAAAAAALCVCLCLGLSGCGGKELYERLLIHGMGVDVCKAGYRVTVRSSASEEEGGEELFTCEGPTLREALETLTLSTGRKPFYAHNYLAVFGRSCAEQGLEECFRFFAEDSGARPAVRLYLAEGNAEEILSAKPEGEYLKMAELQQLGDSGSESGLAVKTEVLDFVNGALRQGSSPVMPVLAMEGEQVRISGTAYFSGDVLRGFLDTEETRGYLAVKKAVKSGGVGLRRRNGAPVFTVPLGAEEKEAARSALNRALFEDRCDIFGFGALLWRKEPDWWKANGAAWSALMARCGYELAVPGEGG